MKIKLRSNYDDFPEKYGASDKQINFYVDNNVYFLENADRHIKNAICLLVEPRAIIPGTYKWVSENWHKFKYVFTFDSEMLKLPNAKLLLYGWINADVECPDIPKTKNISMVASDKAMCEGHISRRRVATELSDRIDTYGKFNGGVYCEDSEYMQGYRFNVAMENYSDGYYFTEKICNCLASRTVPIYWGCPHIGDYFNIDGIIICKTPEEVIEQVDEVLKDPVGEYEKRRDAIEDNLQRVQQYRHWSNVFLKTYGEELEKI